MRLESSRRLRGPNRYLSRPVRVSLVALDELTGRETTDVPGFVDALLAGVPGLGEHHCASGKPGGFVRRLHEGTYFGHVAEHIAIELSNRIGRQVNFGRTEWAGLDGWYDVVIECPVDEPADSTVPVRLLRLAIGAVNALVVGRPPEIDGPLAQIRAAFEAEQPGPSTAAIAAAARARDIPVERVGSLSLLRLGHARHRRLVWAAMTDGTSAVGVDIAGDKQLTRELLDAAGIPVPVGGPARTVDEALARFAELGAPVVVKPRAGRQGAHVYLGLTTEDEVRAAFAAATADPDSREAVVERQLTGRDYRVLVIGGRVAAAAERVAAHVTGDGVTDLAGLIARANADPRRGTGHDRPLTRLAVDTVATTLLARQGFDLASVPATGQVVWLRENANLSTGGTSHDVTGLVHEDVADLCRRAAAVVGLDIAGIDLRLPDISAPVVPGGGAASAGAAGLASSLLASGGAASAGAAGLASSLLPSGSGGVIEVNAAPGLRMHLAPTEGVNRDVGAAIVDALYPAGTPARVPTVAVTGTNGKTTVARLTAHLLCGAGLRVGLTTTDGVYIDGRLIQRADATGPRSAHVVLDDPTVDAAVLETARGGIIRQGLGYDWSDVGVVTNIQPDHLGQDGIDDLDELVDLKALIAERVRVGGSVVLNADDARTLGLAARVDQRRVVWFSLDQRNALVREHWDAGGRAYTLTEGWLVEMADRRRVPLLSVGDLPGAFGGAAPHMVANALAAAAAARELGVPTGCVAQRLRSFRPDRANPGRGQLLRVGGVHVLVDYAHNPAAISAMGGLVQRVWGRDRAIAVVTLPGDRRDDLLVECGQAVGKAFDRVVLYEDRDLRGRASGEVAELVRTALGPAVACTVLRCVEEAVPAALDLARTGDVVLVLYEKIDPVMAMLEAIGARPITDGAGSIPMLAGI
jgi:cyanophycin synthetase